MIDDRAAFWDRRAGGALHDDAFYARRAAAVAELVVRHHPGARVLDVGCGTGLLVRALAERGLDAYGIDISAAMIAVARRRCAPLFGDGEQRLRVASSTEAGADPPFDAVTAIGVLPYVDDRAAFRSDLIRLCRPGGLVVVSMVNHPSLYAAREWLRYVRWSGTGAGRAVLRNLASCGVWSGGAGHPLRRAAALSAEMARDGMVLLDSLVFYNIGLLDRAPRPVVRACRGLAWTYVGCFRRLG